MNDKILELLRRNKLSVTGSRQKILNLFLANTGALAHADIEHKAGEKFDRVRSEERRVGKECCR